MTRSTDDKLDLILEKIGEMSTEIAVFNEWRSNHIKEHDNMTSWKRWVMPFGVTIGMFVWQMFKK